MKTLALSLILLLLPVTAAAQDLSLPSWDLCTGAGGAQMACFTQDEVRQLLRLQEHAQYGVRLNELRLSIEERGGILIEELIRAQENYMALQAVIQERNLTLTSDLIEARAQTERYRSRLERRRIWPWVSLGLGLVTGAVIGFAASN